jgi:hypothetical protein
MGNAAYRAAQKTLGETEAVNNRAYEMGRIAGKTLMGNADGMYQIMNAVSAKDVQTFKENMADGVYNFQDGSILTGISLNQDGSVATMEKTKIEGRTSISTLYNGKGEFISSTATGALPSNAYNINNNEITTGHGTYKENAETATFEGQISFSDRNGNRHDGYGTLNIDNNTGSILNGSIRSGSDIMTIDGNTIK